MSVEVLPLGVECNLKCTYCYQEGMRSAQEKTPFDLEAMKKTLRDELHGTREGFQVFGGEPLLVPIAALEELLALSFELSGGSGIQTNATLVTDAHVALFKRYNTHVGVSMDGPGALNDTRWLGSESATRSATAKSQAALERLLEEHVPCSLIITLTTLNAGSKELLFQLVNWLGELRLRGITYSRVHLLEVDSPKAAALALSEDQAVYAMKFLHAVEPKIGLQLDVFSDMLKLLRADDEDVTCIWNACDPGTTSAVRGVGPRGERLNCGRTNKDGENWLKADSVSHRRQLVLYSTPQEEGGCSGCRFFVACKGQCPGEALNGDPRNRSANCGTWKRLFEFLESRLLDVRVLPISQHPALRSVEAVMLSEWEAGRNISVKRGLALAMGGGVEQLTRNAHGDVPHGDSHGDHTDLGKLLEGKA